tara:strand:+ start:405 stop:635 length:231 start_codon:yes stop_codon:yes gene_type:complete
MAKYSDKLIKSVHSMKDCGKTYKQIASEKKLTYNQVSYIINNKISKTLEELYVQADEAIKDADSLLKRIKRLLFGS